MTAELRQPGVPGGTLGNGAAFVFEQNAPSTLWLVGHNLAMFPSVTIVDTLDREVEADVEYVDENNLTVGFERLATGKAFLS